MKFLLPIIILCATALGSYTKNNLVLDYGTGLKWDPEWRKRVTFYDPTAVSPTVRYPASVDWRPQMPPIANQGQCGSCYIFGTVAALEGTWAIEKNQIQKLSEEQVLSCNNEYDCGGGYFDIMNYFIKGVTTSDKMPYVGYPKTCPSGLPIAEKAASWLFVGDSNGWGSVPTNDQLQYVLQYKPLAATVCADRNFMSYSGGVYDEVNNQCEINHLIALVGYSSDRGGLYYILRNSWGKNWGEKGYMRIRPRANNLAEAAAFVRLPSSK